MTFEGVEIPEWLKPLAQASEEVDPAQLSRFLPPDDPSVRKSAVLILLADGNDGPEVLLTERAWTLRRHAGQMAFPGGGVDPEDGTGEPGLVRTALREAEEETGLDPRGVTVVRTLPELYVRHSDNRVTPVIGWWHDPCAVHPASPDEVESVERVPIAELSDPGNRFLLRFRPGMAGPAFRVRGMIVWGFTAAVLDGLLREGGLEQPWDRERIEEIPPEVLHLAARG